MRCIHSPPPRGQETVWRLSPGPKASPGPGSPASARLGWTGSRRCAQRLCETNSARFARFVQRQWNEVAGGCRCKFGEQSTGCDLDSREHTPTIGMLATSSRISVPTHSLSVEQTQHFKANQTQYLKASQKYTGRGGQHEASTITPTLICQEIQGDHLVGSLTTMETHKGETRSSKARFWFVSQVRIR